jgi:mannose/fructose/N-acetylgalactosamine-specific phosphotransferase system component IID
MTVVTIAWMYVVLMMALVEAMSPQGSVLGAVFTFLLYGVLPLGIVLYLMGTPARRRMRKRAEAQPPEDR